MSPRRKKRTGGKGLSLRGILLLYVLVPLAVSMALIGFTAFRVWEEQVETRMQKDLEVVARAIQLPLSHAMERDREGGMNQALESALSLDSVYSAYAYDLEGDQIASAGKQDPKPEERDKLTDIASKGERKGEYGEVAERDVYSYYIPLKDSRNQSSGLLQLTRRQDDFKEYTEKVRHHALIGFGLALSIVTGLVLVGQHQALGRHFRRLVSGMNRIANGETSHRITPAGPREIASISTSFNEMLDSIQRAEEEIKKNRRKQLRLEKELKQKEKLAAVGQLAAGVAHELGTPLSTISGVTQRGLRHESAEAPTSKLLKRIRRETERMEIIIRQLLDFSHSQNLQYRKLRPSQVAESAVAAVSNEAAKQNAEISVEGDKAAPSFMADPVRLEQALVNLLRNSIQAGTQVSVSLGWRMESGQIIFRVEDNGPGIPKDVRSRMFEPFFTTKNVGSGTGLGLAVVHGIVKEHGGEIEVGDGAAGGTRIEIYIPTEQNRGA